MVRTDETTVLAAIYGDDFSNEVGTWGLPALCVRVRPPDLESKNVGSELT